MVGGTQRQPVVLLPDDCIGSVSTLARLGQRCRLGQIGAEFSTAVPHTGCDLLHGAKDSQLHDLRRPSAWPATSQPAYTGRLNQIACESRDTWEPIIQHRYPPRIQPLKTRAVCAHPFAGRPATAPSSDIRSDARQPDLVAIARCSQHRVSLLYLHNQLVEFQERAAGSRIKTAHSSGPM